MSMASDIAEDPDTLRIHYDMREQHINLAGIKAMIAAARGIEPDLQPMGEAFAGVWCADHFVGADKMMADSEGGEI